MDEQLTIIFIFIPYASCNSVAWAHLVTFIDIYPSRALKDEQYKRIYCPNENFDVGQ